MMGNYFLCCMAHEEKAMAPHSSTFAWKIPWTEETGRLQSMGLLESDTTEQLHFHFSLSCIGEGNGNPIQCSCLENPRDWGAWWAAIYGVVQSWTRLKRLSDQQWHMELCSMLCGSLDGRGVWGRVDTCIHMAESLCCSPETITTLLIGYTAIQLENNKKNSHATFW